jgi:hypothetical protein
MDISNLFKTLLSGVTSEEISYSADTKLAKEDWKQIEKPVSDTQDVLLKLMDGGSNEAKVYMPTPTVIGDVAYLSYRQSIQKIVGFDILPEILLQEKKKQKSKKLSKKAIIIAQNTEKQMTNAFSNILEIYKTHPQFLLTNISVREPVEFILLRLLLSCPEDKSALVKWIIMAERTILAASVICNNSIAIDDIKRLLPKVKTKTKFTYEMLNETSPRDFLGSYSLLNTNSVDLYPFQKEFVEFTTANKNNPYIVKLNAMIGQGKTMVSAHLAFQIKDIVNTQFAQWRSNQNPDAPVHTAQLYFICAVTTVRTEVGKYCYSQQCPYSIATWDFAKSLPKVTPANICKKTFGARNKKKNIILEPVRICDPLSGLYLLKNMKPQELSDKVVFLDEPTICADQTDSFISKIIVNIMPLARQVVWSSATMPKNSEIAPIIDDWSQRYNGEIKTISAMKSQIGCQLISMTGKRYYPHTGCISVADVERIIHSLQTNPFVCRMYTVKAVFELDKKIFACSDIGGNLEGILGENLELTHTKMIELCMKLLRNLADSATPEVIQQVCALDDSKDDDSPPIKLIVENLGLLEAKDIFQNQTLIATNDTIAVAKKMLASIANEKKINLASCEKQMKLMESKHEAQLKIQKKQIDRIQQRYKEKYRIEEEMEKVVNAEFMELGDLRHLVDKQYGVDLFKIIEDSTTHEWIKMCLMAGIGIYSSSVDILSQEYKSLVSSLASEGKLRFVIIDDSVIYGTDWPVGNVVCLNDMADSHSVPSLIQLFGRAGRINRCYTANAFASEVTLEKILDYIINDRVSIEGANMVSVFNTFKQFEASYQ